METTRITDGRRTTESSDDRLIPTDDDVREVTDRNGRMGFLGEGLKWISAVAGTLFTALSLAIGNVLETGPEPTDSEEPATTEVHHG